MKKSLLALIIAPLFVYAAENNIPPKPEKNITEVKFSPLFYGEGATFSDKKEKSDRSAGVSELKQVFEQLSRYILEAEKSRGLFIVKLHLISELQWMMRDN